jgi:uncharacterized DUF497 family protein
MTECSIGGGPKISGNPSDAVNIEWDEDNEAHISEHGVTPREAEEVLSSPVLWVRHGRIPERWFAFGSNEGGRKLKILFDYDERRETIRPFSGWEATKGEVEKYF